MIVIPAIDLMDGKAVRLIKGRKENVTVYSENPIELIDWFNFLGVRRVHIVDLDAAFSGGEKNNRKLIRKLAEKSKSLVEVGGGIRSLLDAEEVLCCYVERLVIGTIPIKDPKEFKKIVDRFGEKIVAGVDVEHGFVKVSGWQEDSQLEHIQFLLKMKEMGLKEAIVTDISRDGTLAGVDVDFYKNVAMKTGLDIIVSGGIRDLDDIKALKNLEKLGVKGVIVGKAIYEKTLDLKEALELQDG